MKEPLASDLAGLRLEVSTPGSTGDQADERAGDLQTNGQSVSSVDPWPVARVWMWNHPKHPRKRKKEGGLGQGRWS